VNAEREALEASIDAAVDDAARYAVLGDWYAQAGHPRGELIALHRTHPRRRTPRVAVLVMGTNDLARELRAALVPGRHPLVPHLATALAAARARSRRRGSGVRGRQRGRRRRVSESRRDRVRG
jgi:hypothetical protein